MTEPTQKQIEADRAHGSATGRKFWWSCPSCGEINASPADKRPENTVGCRCGWGGQWRKTKSPVLTLPKQNLPRAVNLE